ncbi:MaoC family dehydratase [Tropicimonas sp. IMCC6043]|uniref:MaoC family dehydratase n=1 Tax=Tropicimonas sp. IMCC6043 TaxID=2510645 RepID=UPI00101C8EA7|nr:MaoC family dehydratase [Tropicimonas sp. IMCC6043]RYH06805.1 MaoC family dehydratase [Tropicimonas sp. IMCC6043]
MTRDLNGLRQVDTQRFREDPGLDFEDFEVGDIYEHWPGRTITETDNIWFTNLTMNTHPLHFDVNYAAQSEFGKPLVNSTLTLAIVTGMTVSSTSQKAIANLGWEEIKLPNPVFVGDTLYAETEVLGKRESKSRPAAGIVRVRHSGKNQNGDSVIHMVRSFLAAKRGHSLVDAVRDRMA